MTRSGPEHLEGHVLPGVPPVGDAARAELVAGPRMVLGGVLAQRFELLPSERALPRSERPFGLDALTLE